MCIIGINHSGHDLVNISDTPWFRLLPQQNFVQFAFDEIKEMISKNTFQTIETEPRTYAESHFDWEVITSVFHDWLLKKSE